MADRCLCHAYFEGVYDKQIKQGQDFDLAQGVRAIDGYGNEVDFTYEPTEIDLCKTGDQEVTYKAFGASFNVIPKLCMPKYKKGVSIPEACPSDLEMITAKRIIRIIRASNPRFLGTPRVTITENEAFDPTEGVTAVDDNGNTIDFNYEGKYDLVAEGDGIASFETEYEQNANAVEVALESIQDLNGYDKPWSGGNGVNLFNKDEDISARNYYYDASGTKITSLNYRSSMPIKIKGNTAYYWAINGIPIQTGAVHQSPRVAFFDADLEWISSGSALGNLGTSDTSPQNAVYAVLPVYVASPQTVAYAMYVEGSASPTTYSPYSNICPISGHTECVTSVSGVNVWDEEWEEGTINTNGDNSSSTTRWRTKNYIGIKPNAQYYFKGTKTGSGTAAIRPRFYDINKVYIGNTSQSGTDIVANTVFTTPTNAYYMRFTPDKSGTYGILTDEVSINYPSTDHDYHAYNGNTYTTTLGRTVYGGTLDVVSGELTDKMKLIDMGGLNWAYQSSTQRFIADITNAKRPPNNYTKANIVCSIFATVTAEASERPANDQCVGLSKYGTLGVRDSSHTDVASFKSAMSGVQLVYELATPQTYQLTPQQVELLKGTNNVWSEEGNVRVIYGGNIPQDGSFEYPLEGEYTITYKATDKCGNEGTAERTIVVTPSE